MIATSTRIQSFPFYMLVKESRDKGADSGLWDHVEWCGMEFDQCILNIKTLTNETGDNDIDTLFGQACNENVAVPLKLKS